MQDVLLVALIVGLLVGAIPLFFGMAKQKVGLALGGFATVVISALILGLILALPVAAVFVFFIARDEEVRET